MLQESNAERILLVHGAASFLHPKVQSLIGAIQQRVGALSTYDASGINPELSAVKRLSAVYRNLRPDIVVAIGGGSVLDSCKAAKALCGFDVIEEVSFMKNDVAVGDMRIFAVPTTCGTGSEVTPFATVYLHGVKYSIENERIVADVSFIDSELCSGQSPTQHASGCIDSICQSIESSWSRKATAESSAYATAALRFSSESLSDIGHDFTPNQAHKLSRAASLSGKAIAISKTTAPHAFSYALTMQFAVPHGIAVALFMRPMLRLHEIQQGMNAHTVQRIQWNALSQFSPLKTSIVEKWDVLMRGLKLPYTFKMYGIDRQSIINLLPLVNVDRLGNHPVAFSIDELAELIE